MAANQCGGSRLDSRPVAADSVFEVDVHQIDEAAGPAATVVVAGEIDLATAPQFGEALEQAGGTGAATVRVDMAGVTFLDSSGISVLVQSQQRLADAGRKLVLHEVTEQVRRVLDISGLEAFFEVSDLPAR